MEYSRKRKIPLIDSDFHLITISRQTELLNISRASYYYVPHPNQEKEQIKTRLRVLYAEYPFLGSRRLSILLKQDGYAIGRRSVRNLMKTLGLKTLYPHKNTSMPCKQHQKYPYLLNDTKIIRANQVWSTDITYIRLKRGFVYLIAIIDWYSRKVLSWRIANSMDLSFCIEVLEEALAKYGTPEIFNTDQGSQFTSNAFTNILKLSNIHISMDSKGRYADNIFVERLWRSIKQEEIYLKEYASPLEVIISMRKYMLFYNSKRPHQSLGYKTPQEVYDLSILTQTVIA